MSRRILIEAFLPEFDHEMEYTREFLIRVPEDKLTWRPHPKSMTMGRLAGHLAELPGWAAVIIEADSFDVARSAREPLSAASRDGALAVFDANVAHARSVLATTDDARLLQPWSFARSGQVLYTKPRYGVLRNTMLNHIVHHRAQLGVYFRLNDIPVPAVYGPSADESPRPQAK
jgi:uncharacterized damage-inducible protein DinB